MATYTSNKQFSNGSYGNYTHYLTLSYEQDTLGNYTKINNLLVQLQNRTPNLSWPYGTLTGTATIYKWENEKWVLQCSEGFSLSVNLNSTSLVTLKNATPNQKIEHNNDGTCKIRVVIETAMAGVAAGPDGTTTYDITLPDIPRANTISCSSPYIGDTAIITISKKISEFTSTVAYEIGTLTGTIAEKTSETVLSLDTNSLKEEIYTLMPKEKSIKGTIKCTTYSGDTKIGDTTTAEFSLYAKEDECKPDVDGTVIDTNEATIAVTGDSSKLVKHLSKPKVTVTATPKNSATIDSYSINLNDGQTSEQQEHTFDKIESDKITVNATDSRGYSNSKDLTPQVVDYVKLHINLIDVSRIEDISTEVLLNADGVWFNGSFSDTIQNTLNASYKYRASDSTEWIDGGTLEVITDGNTFKFIDVSLGAEYDYNKEYQFKIILTDTLMTVGSEDKEIVIVPKGQEAIAIGEDTVWVYGDLLINDKNLLDLTYPIGSTYISVEDTNPSTLFGGEWEQLKDRFLLAAGDTYTAGVTGGEAEHTLTVDEIPPHTHQNKNSVRVVSGTTYYVPGLTTSGYDVVTTGSTGGGKAHNNMPPYLTVYMWKRIA